MKLCSTRAVGLSRDLSTKRLWLCCGLEGIIIHESACSLRVLSWVPQGWRVTPGLSIQACKNSLLEGCVMS